MKTTTEPSLVPAPVPAATANTLLAPSILPSPRVSRLPQLAVGALAAAPLVLLIVAGVVR